MRKIQIIIITLFLIGCSNTSKENLILPVVNTKLLDEAKEYITENSKNPKDFVIDVFKNKDIVLIGEYHRIKENVDFI